MLLFVEITKFYKLNKTFRCETNRISWVRLQLETNKKKKKEQLTSISNNKYNDMD